MNKLSVEEWLANLDPKIKNAACQSLECGGSKTFALAKLITTAWKEAPESVAKVHAGRKKWKA